MRLLDDFTLGLHPVHEDIAHGDEPRARIRAQRLRTRACVAAAAADHADFEGVTARGMGRAREVQRAERGGGRVGSQPDLAIRGEGERGAVGEGHLEIGEKRELRAGRR